MWAILYVSVICSEELLGYRVELSYLLSFFFQKRSQFQKQCGWSSTHPHVHTHLCAKTPKTDLSQNEKIHSFVKSMCDSVLFYPLSLSFLLSLDLSVLLVFVKFVITHSSSPLVSFSAHFLKPISLFILVSKFLNFLPWS